MDDHKEELPTYRKVLNIFDDIFMYSTLFIMTLIALLFLARIIQKDPNFISIYYKILTFGCIFNALTIASYKATSQAISNEKAPIFIVVYYNILQWYNWRFMGFWNTVLAFNRFTGLFFWRYHKRIWSGIPLIIIISIMIAYPFILSGYSLGKIYCLVVKWDHDINCFDFFAPGSLVNYNNIATAGISLILGLATALSRHIKGNSWQKAQKYETYLLVQSIISSLFLMISEGAGILTNVYVNAVHLSKEEHLEVFKWVFVAVTNWTALVYLCSSGIVIFCLSKGIRNSAILFYRLYYIPGVKNPLKPNENSSSWVN